MASIEKVLSDAKMLVTRLRDHDNSADTLITQTTTLYKKIDAMKQYQEDLTVLNEMARHRPRSALILSLVQENTRIRELQNENKDLRNALEEHQSALELIMSKYREQIIKLVVANKLEKSSETADNTEEMNEKIEKIAEMAAVMQKAASLDEAEVTKQQEIVSQLKTENMTLRNLLKNSMLQLLELEGVDRETQTGTSPISSTSSLDSEKLDETVIAVPPKETESAPKSASPNDKSKKSSPNSKSPSNKSDGDTDTSTTDSDFDTGTIKKSTIKKQPKKTAKAKTTKAPAKK